MKAPEEALVPNNEEISILYTYSREMWDRIETVIDDIFAFAVASEISKGNDDNDNDKEPRTLNECIQRKDWPKWEIAIKAKLEFLNKRGVFGPIVQTPKGINHVSYKWVFVNKGN